MKEKQVTSILNKHKKRDDWFLTEYSVNPYEGCSCNCRYCYIRGSKYGQNMEEGMAIKSNAIPILEKQLKSRAARNQYGFVAVGSATDAYLPHDRKYELTRRMLELLLKYRFPAFISTKTDGIIRDLDLLKEIDKNAIVPPDLKGKLNRGCILSTSISTMDESISRALEPATLLPMQRLELIQHLKKEGFLAGVNAIPVLPFITDTETELEQLINAATQHDADYILIGSLTLFGTDKADSKTLYYEFLRQRFPSLIPYYDQLYGNAYYPPFDYQLALKNRAEKIAEKYKIRTRIIPTNVLI
jgi:DNA repair photolyase